MADFHIHTGSRNGFDWLSLRGRYHVFGSFLKAIPTVVEDQFVAITSFDGGPSYPTDEERGMGWHRKGRVVWTTKITDPTVLSWDNGDEWYIFESPKALPRLKIFVNFIGFGLDDPRLWQDLIPTWDRHQTEGHLKLQEVFWQQISKCNPLSYLAEGDVFNLATRDGALFQEALEWSKCLCVSESDRASERDNARNTPDN